MTMNHKWVVGKGKGEVSIQWNLKLAGQQKEGRKTGATMSKPHAGAMGM